MGKAPRPAQYPSLLVEGLSSIKKKCLSYDFHRRNGDSEFPQRLHSFETNSCLWASLLGCSDSRASTPPNSTKARSFFLVAPTGCLWNFRPRVLGFGVGLALAYPQVAKGARGLIMANVTGILIAWQAVGAETNPSGGACLWTGARHPSPVGKKKTWWISVEIILPSHCSLNFDVPVRAQRLPNRQISQRKLVLGVSGANSQRAQQSPTKRRRASLPPTEKGCRVLAAQHPRCIFLK